MGARPSPTAAITVVSSPTRRPRSTMNPASASTKKSFPNSDGWNWNGPTSIQRFEPRIASAYTNTKTISPIVPP